MRRGPRRFQLPVLLTWLLLVTACGTGSAVSPDPELGLSPAPDVLSSDETRGLLADPETAERGVWSLLANLNLGVYTPHGGQILAGAERSERDFFLYDFELPTLVRMTAGDPRSIDHLAWFMSQALEVELSGQELVALYAEVFSTIPDHFISRFFAGNPPREGWRVSPLEEWVLLVALLPIEVERVGMVGPQLLTAGPLLLATGHCSSVQGNGGEPGGEILKKYLEEAEKAAGQGVAGAVGGIVDKLHGGFSKFAGAIGKVVDLARLSLILENIEVSLDATPSKTHRFHDTEGEKAEDNRIEIVARVIWRGANPPDDVDCGDLAKVGDFPPPGPLEDAGVRFTTDQFLIDHGYLRRASGDVRARQLTNSSGEVVVWYETKKEEPPEAQRLGDGALQQGSGKVFAEFDFLGAMGEFFNAFAFVEILADLVDGFRLEYPIVVEWHELNQWVLEGTGIANSLGAIVSLDGTFGVDAEGRISGQATLGFDGQCYTLTSRSFPVGGQALDDVFQLTFETTPEDYSGDHKGGCGAEETAERTLVEGAAFVGIQYIVGTQGPFQVEARELATFAIPIDFDGTSVNFPLDVTIFPDLGE